MKRPIALIQFAIAVMPVAAQLPSAQQEITAALGRAAILRITPASRGEALRTYEHVLQLAPENVEALANVAVLKRQSGDWNGAVAALSDAAKADPANRQSYFVEAGHVCREAHQSAAAEQWYRRATTAGLGDDDRPWLGLLGLRLEAIGPSPTAETLMPVVTLADQAAASGETSVARDALERTIEQGYLTAPKIAENAFVRWVGLESADRLSSASVDRLPPAKLWNPPLVAAIRTMVATGTRPDAESGWTATSVQRDVVAAAALSVAKTLESKKRNKEALDLMLYAWYTAPSTGSDRAQLESAIALARMYQNHPELDPNGFARLEERLFNLKGGAYFQGDVESENRLHATLGLIYVERGQWTGDYATNALFQLSHAISTGEQLTRRDGVPRPVPALRTYLAEAYQHAGRQDEAAMSLVAAAIDDLDSDVPSDALRSLENARRIGLGVDASQLAEVLDRTARVRQQLLDVNASIPENVETVLALLDKERSRLPAGFAVRQQFRILTDMGTRLARQERLTSQTITTNALEDASKLYFARARGALASGVKLYGTGDELRVEALR